MTTKKKVGSKPAPRSADSANSVTTKFAKSANTGVRFSTWTSTSTPEQDDDLLDLTISLRFTIERQRR